MPTLRDPMDCSPPGSSTHGIFQARVLGWGAIAFRAYMPYDPAILLLSNIPEEIKTYFHEELYTNV